MYDMGRTSRLFSESYIDETSVACRSSAEKAAISKVIKYKDLTPHYVFVSFALKTMGPMYSSGLEFLLSLRKRMSNISGDRRDKSFLSAAHFHYKPALQYSLAFVNCWRFFKAIQLDSSHQTLVDLLFTSLLS